MTRDEAIAIAKAAAMKDPERHAYTVDSDCSDWMPHEWVIEAIRESASLHPRPIRIPRLIDWLDARYRAAGGKEGITDLSCFAEDGTQKSSMDQQLGGFRAGCVRALQT